MAMAGWLGVPSLASPWNVTLPTARDPPVTPGPPPHVTPCPQETGTAASTILGTPPAARAGVGCGGVGGHGGETRVSPGWGGSRLQQATGRGQAEPVLPAASRVGWGARGGGALLPPCSAALGPARPASAGPASVSPVARSDPVGVALAPHGQCGGGVSLGRGDPQGPTWLLLPLRLPASPQPPRQPCHPRPSEPPGCCDPPALPAPRPSVSPQASGSPLTPPAAPPRAGQALWHVAGQRRGRSAAGWGERGPPGDRDGPG